MISTLCVVQARTGSSRLPGKVLQPIAGVPMLEFMLRRLAALRVDELVVATSVLDRDDAVVAIAERCGAGVTRGSEHDVLGRFAGALRERPARHVVRLTADCPLVDASIVEGVLARHFDARADYTSNVLPRTFPKGLDVEVLRADALLAADAEATEPAEREHVTPFVYRRPERFKLANLRSGLWLGDQRWTVDTHDDLEFVRALVDAAGTPTADFRALLRVAPRIDPSDDLWFRPAEATDAARVLAWRNDPDAVRWSGTGEAIDSIDHARWFAQVLDDPGRRIWIGIDRGEPVGYVRVDVRCGIGTVSVAVDPQQRGCGYGTRLIQGLGRLVAADCQVVELVALVHPHNPASVTAFGRAGYAPVDTADNSSDRGWTRLSYAA